MKLRTLIPLCTPKTRLQLITRDRVVCIKAGADGRTLYALHCMDMDIISIRPATADTMEVKLNG